MENTEKLDTKHGTKKRKIGFYIGIGTAIGAGVGAAIGNIGVGVRVGVTIGAGIGVALKRKQEGMQTFDQAIYNFYMQGKINYETAIAYADSANDLRLRIKFDTPDLEEETENKPIFKIREQ